MQVAKGFRAIWTCRWAGLGLALLALVLSVGPAASAIRFKRSGEATLGGADALADLHDACESGDGRVWVGVEGRGDCIAFYASAGLLGASQAVFYFEGDIPSGYRNDVQKLAAHLASVRRALDILAGTYRVPYVFVARPGTFGSTGNHGDRRKVREALVMNAAVDAVKSRFRLRHVSLAGQSGGATIAAALLTLGRSDIRCAAPASGGYDLPAMLDWHAERQGLGAGHREHPALLAGSFNVMDRITGIPPDPTRRIFIIGDAEDRVTPFAQQRRFAERLAAAGHHAELVEIRAAGPDHHGLTLASLRAAGLCASGVGDKDIRRMVKP